VSELKYLYANGDSWTFGKNNYVREEERWSKLLSDKLGLTEINESSPGNGNDRMVRTTLEWFDNNKDKWDNVVVLLGFIPPMRVEFFNDEENTWSTLNYRDVSSADYGDIDFWKKYLNFFGSDVALYYNLKNQALLLTSFFDSNNIKYLMFYSWGMKNNEKNPTMLGFKDHKYFLPNNFQDYLQIQPDCSSPSNPKWFTACDHPSANAHKIWTEKLSVELKDRKVI
jgi:hypothetical protein